MKGKIFRACVQSVLKDESETWAMKAENMQNLWRAEPMTVRWMFGVSLKDRKRSEILYSLLGIQTQSMANMGRHGRLRWFGYMERKNGDDWVSACRNVVVAGVRCVGRGRKKKMAWLCLVCTLNGQCSGICGETSYQEKRLTPAARGRNGRFKNK